MAWILVPCLVSLLAEFNALFPGRDKASDGSIGDEAHQQTSSDHNPDETSQALRDYDADSKNEVHAIDVDKDLRKPGWSMQECVDIIVGRHALGIDDRLQNVIYNRHIWSRSWGWGRRDYTGANPHDKHAHFSSRYTGAEESDTRHWGLLEADMPTVEEIAQGNANKLYADLQNPNSGLHRAFDERVQAGVESFLWDAIHAARQDDYYQAQSAARQQQMRTRRDISLNADIVQNPYADAATNPTITLPSALKGAATADKVVREIQPEVAALRAEVELVRGMLGQVLAVLAPTDS